MPKRQTLMILMPIYKGEAIIIIPFSDKLIH